MDTKTFFEKFELFADAPDAVERMRELILKLATQGELVSQDGEDEPADLLLSRIAGLREKLIGEGLLKRVTVEPDPLPEVSEVLPSGWILTRLGNTFDVRDGTHATPKYTAEGYPLITSKNLYSGQLSFENTNLISEDDHRQICERSRVDRDDILFAMIGSIGNPVIVDTDIEFSIKNVALFKYISKNDSEPRYLLIFLKFAAVAMRVEAAGGVQSFVSLGYLRNFPFPLPPLAEQKRIVAKVDELMALCDRLAAQQTEREQKHSGLSRASLARFAESPTPANLEFLFHDAYTIDPADMRKSILTLAVQGKLVRQDPKDEPAESEVRKARSKLQLGEWKSEVDESNLSFDLPSNWACVQVEDVADSRLGKMLDVQKNRGEPHPYLRNTNVHWFRFELDSIKTMLLDRKELEDFRLKRGDVMICEGGHGIARTAVWEEQIPGMMFQKALHRVRPFLCLNPYFFALCIRVYEASGILQTYYTGAGIPHFTGRSLDKVVFPLPPLAEQRRIVAKVDQLMALVDQLETQLTTSRTTAEKLLEAVVAELTAA